MDQTVAEAVRSVLGVAQAHHEALPFWAILVRLGFALFLGAIIGIERETRDRPAGLRTHMLISLASALFVLIALEIAVAPPGAEGALDVDPTRVLEAVTAGVAFLAAGSIIRSGTDVKGLTTGAAMWMAAAVGVACGVGWLILAAIVAFASLIVLFLVRMLEPR